MMSKRLADGTKLVICFTKLLTQAALFFQAVINLTWSSIVLFD